jgi:hypothetical protein
MFQASMTGLPFTLICSSCDTYSLRCPDRQVVFEFGNLMNHSSYLKSEKSRLNLSSPYDSYDPELSNIAKSLQATRMCMTALIHIAKAIDTVHQPSSKTFHDLMELLIQAKRNTLGIVWESEYI